MEPIADNDVICRRRYLAIECRLRGQYRLLGLVAEAVLWLSLQAGICTHVYLCLPVVPTVPKSLDPL